MLTHPLREPSDRKEERGREGEGAGRTRRGEGKRGKSEGEWGEGGHGEKGRGRLGRRGGGEGAGPPQSRMIKPSPLSLLKPGCRNGRPPRTACYRRLDQLRLNVDHFCPAAYRLNYRF